MRLGAPLAEEIKSQLLCQLSCATSTYLDTGSYEPSQLGIRSILCVAAPVAKLCVDVPAGS